VIAKGAAALAKALPRHLETVRRWIRNGCPRRKDGTFDVDQVRKWARAQRTKAGQNGREALLPNDSQGQDRGGGTSEVDRFRKMRTLREAIQVRKLQGELIDRGEVVNLLLARLLTFRRDLEAMVRAPELAAVRTILELKVRAMLERYANTADLPLVQPHDDVDDAPAEEPA